MRLLFYIMLALSISLTTTSATLSSPNAAQQQSKIATLAEPLPDEAETVAQAVEALKNRWLDVYSREGSPSQHGYLHIANTHISYIRESFATRDLSGVNGASAFQDVYCVVEFMMLSDYLGSAPYYTYTAMYETALVYRDGTVEISGISPFKLYSTRTYSYDYSDIIEAVRDCGDAYNATYYLLDETPYAEAEVPARSDEAAVLSKAVDALRRGWLAEYTGKYGMSRNGYLNITHTRISYIREDFAAQDLSESKAAAPFQNAYCVVEFLLMSDYNGTAPYYSNATVWDSVIVYRDGTAKAVQQSPFRMYSARTYDYDYTDMIEEVRDCGDACNAVYYLLYK